jgi:hypothetical protein
MERRESTVATADDSSSTNFARRSGTPFRESHQAIPKLCGESAAGKRSSSRDALLNEVWGVDYYGTTRTLDQLIVKLRQKIEDTPAEPRHLLTVHTLGYRLEV